MRIYQCTNCNRFFYEHNLKIYENADIYGDWSIIIGKGKMFECPDCEGCEFVIFNDDEELQFESEALRDEYI